MIKGYSEFVNEEFIFNNSKNDINKFLTNLIKNNVPTEEIIEFKHDLDKILSVNESIKDEFNTIKFKYGRWLNDKMFKWLINRKKKFYSNLAEKLGIFDLTTLDDVYKHFPGFKLESLYLAGGMDEADDTGKGWRLRLEWEFEKNNSGKSNPKLDIIEIYDEEIKPAYVVDGENLDDFLENPKKTLKLYDKPALLNPVRKEIDRTKDDTFDRMVGDLKNPGYNPDEDIKPFNWFRKTFANNIEPDDEHLLRIADAIFLGQDATAGAGTYGELELVSLIRKPLFAWLVNESADRAGAFKLWNMPHLCKVARTEDDMEQLVKTIVRCAKK